MDRRQDTMLRRVRRRQYLGAEPLSSRFQRDIGECPADIDPQPCAIGPRLALFRHAPTPRPVLEIDVQCSARCAVESTAPCFHGLTRKPETANMSVIAGEAHGPR